MSYKKLRRTAIVEWVGAIAFYILRKVKMYEHICLGFLGLLIFFNSKESFLKTLGIFSFVLNFAYVVLGIIGGCL